MSAQTEVLVDVDLSKEAVCSCCKKPPVTWKVLVTCPACGVAEEPSCQSCKDEVDRIAAKHGTVDKDGKFWTVKVRCKMCRTEATLRWEKI